MNKRILLLCLLWGNITLIWSQIGNDTTVFRIKFLAQDSVRRRDSTIYKNCIKVQTLSYIAYRNQQITYERKLLKRISTELSIGLSEVDDFVLDSDDSAFYEVEKHTMEYRTMQLVPNVLVTFKYYFKEVFKGFSVGPVFGYRPMKSKYYNPNTQLSYQERFSYTDVGVQGAYMVRFFKKRRVSIEIFFQGGFRNIKNDYISLDAFAKEKVTKNNYNSVFATFGVSVGVVF